MGEISEMKLEGILCESCGAFIDAEGCGFPTLCKDCITEMLHRRDDD